MNKKNGKNNIRPIAVAQQSVVVQKTDVKVKTGDPKYIEIPDTNVFIDEPDSVDELRKGGNLLVVTGTVLLELDKLKNAPGIGPEVREVIRRIEAASRLGDTNLIIERGMDFSGTNLDKNIPDHRILATVNYVVNKTRTSSKNNIYHGYDAVKVITGDNMVKILARLVIKSEKLIIEPYRRSQIKINQRRLTVPILKVSGVSHDRQSFPAKGKSLRTLPENSLVIGYEKKENSKKGEMIAIKKHGHFKIYENSIKAYGISAKHNGGKNWEQIAALHLLLDENVPCVIMQGGAGTGKTLLSLAAALHQRNQKESKVSRIIISRPVVPLDYDQQLGYLPGDINQKMSPWVLPIVQNLQMILSEKAPSAEELVDRFNRSGNDKEKPKVLDTFDFLEQYGISIQPLDSIRGTTFWDAIIIIDEAQNLTRHQAKTIATRVGQNTKIIFNGDLSQIDNHHLKKETSGLTYLMSRLAGSELVGIVNFKETLRSPFSSLAERLL